MTATLDPNGQCHKIELADLDLTDNATLTIGLAVKDLAAITGIDEHEITKRLMGDMWWREEDGALMLYLSFPRGKAETMLVEIPKAHWGVKGQAEAVAQ